MKANQYRRVKMEEMEAYCDEKSKSHDESFSMLHFQIFDTINWKYLEPCLPVNPEAFSMSDG